MDKLDRRIINRLQKGLPLVESPFEQIAREIDCSENELIKRLEEMLGSGLLTRFGPMFDAQALGGAFTLAAMKVPTKMFEEVAEIVNSLEQVAHNYEREHELNMWFVIGTESQQEIQDVIDNIETQTQLKVYSMPKEEEFYVGLYLNA